MDIDVRRKAGRICPLWFGHNLEHTRSCIWEGLGAQLIRNRKFAGGAGREGVARHWHRVGGRGCLYILERSGGKRGLHGETYTAHFDPAVRGAMQRQTIRSFEAGAACGIAQRGISLIGGREYECRLALQADRELPVRVRLCGSSSAGEYFRTTVTAEAGRWTEHRFNFVCPASDADACLEIAFDRAGALHVGAVSLMPADHLHGMRRDVVELLKEISVPILRWPGGNFAGSYRWRDGLLPADRRAPLWGSGILPHTDGHDDHEIGTDEFLALCREIGAEPWITINMGLEGPQDAAAWVEYCNGPPASQWGRRRAERGHPQPHNVRYWSLGNEMGYGHMAGPNTPREYAEMASACAKAMRQADASIVLVCSGTWEDDAWYEHVLAEIGDCFEHVSYHEYTDLVKAYEGRPGRDELRRMAAAPRATLGILEGIRARLDARAPGGKSIGISFDEWNVWHCWFRVPGVLEGIHTACMLNMFCREARRVGMTIGAYFEPVNEGAILVGPGSCRLTPAGEVFALFRSHHGNELLEVDALAAEAGLDVAASVNEAAREVFVTLVNADGDEARRADIVMRNVGDVAEASAVALACPNILPESEFTKTRPDVVLSDGHSLAVAVPPHGVAGIRVRYR